MCVMTVDANGIVSCLRGAVARVRLPPSQESGSPPSFDAGTRGENDRVLVAASTVAIVAIAAATIVVALVVWYVVPPRRPARASTSQLGICVVSVAAELEVVELV